MPPSVPIKLSPSQQAAFNEIIEKLPTERIILLQGGAGTGKTTMTQIIANYFYDHNVFICAIAPTHKAKRVIEATLNKNMIIPITAFTIASALSKIREHSYIGTQHYGQANLKKLSMYTLFLIDEVSMIDDEDMKIILDYVRQTRKQAILIGDSNQIPCPSAGFDKIEGTELCIRKKDLYVFTDPSIYRVTLTDIVRQAVNSPIIRLATYVREHLLEDFTILDTDNGREHIIPPAQIYSTFETLYRTALVAGYSAAATRIIAYTNAAVRTHNTEIRRRLAFDDTFVVGDVLMSYTTYGFPEPLIENGQDYIISAVTPTETKKIGIFEGLCGNLVSMKIVDDTPHTPPIKDLFFINIYNPANHSFICEIIKRAQKVNSIGSTKNDYLAYKELKNCVLFIEDVYKYDRKIYTALTFRESHPLLFTSISELVRNGREKIASILADKVEKAYPSLIDERLTDRKKLMSDSENLADRYMVIEKDMYYGYAITAHKSQGSTYNSVIVDEIDFQKVANRWNFKFNALESRIKEKNQLRYVGYTRARDNLYISYEIPRRSRGSSLAAAAAAAAAEHSEEPPSECI